MFSRLPLRLAGEPTSTQGSGSFRRNFLASSGLANAGRDTVLASVLLHIFELLLGIVEGFLFVGDLLFVLRVLLVSGAGVAQAVAGVGIEGCRANLVLALHYVELALH